MSQQRELRAALAGGSVLLFLWMGGVQATPLAPPGVAGQVLFSNPPVGIQVNAFGTFPLSGPNGSLQFTAAGTPAPFLSADATMVPFFFGRASGTLVYQMEVLGPAGDVPVSVTVSGGVSGSSQLLSGDTFAGFAMTSLWRFDTIGGTTIIPEEGINTPSLTGSFSQSFGQTHELMLTANQVYKVTTTVSAGARAGSASAFIDPIFSFGPGAGQEYSFNFSDGIGNAPIPEPGTNLLLSAGLLVVSTLSRGKARRTAVAGSGTRHR
jgi:hypothetical protein